ncbi:FecR domain-containing protein [Bosea sp. ANAM02]|uniref:FecR domain-containing protein n=1 Tax=Bosea sp. ANAM02 TaxID=2020412 RepID=UPI00140F0201|nr:FecR domain-containing protein [Bosea sp. ANAM02]BCB21684.1 membrane protein [Bosea sp. ANAM02]
MTGRFAFWLAAAAALICVSVLPAAAQNNTWKVAKTSGEAWIGSASHPASLTQTTELRPGDSIRTGRNGRVLLIRGQETILVSPNSAISLPEAGRSGLSTIIQQAGTIMLDVEKRNVQHFEVETPYLAAVVKGTRFRVSIAGGQAKVDVVRGQVQVTDFRSGEYTLVNPQQFARSSGTGAPGLKLGGSGELGAVTRGPAQAPRVQPLSVPAGGLKPDAGSVPLRSNARPTTSARAPGSSQPVIARMPGGGARIVAPIGELHLNIREVTNGMARNQGADGSKSKSLSSRLQPGNGGNDIRLDNSGSAGPNGNGASSGSAVSGALASGSAAAGVIVSNAATAGIGLGGGGQNGQSGQNGQNGQSGLNGQSGQNGQNGSGLLDALIDNRGRGNAYGLLGGNGIGKALGLGKKN